MAFFRIFPFSALFVWACVLSLLVVMHSTLFAQNFPERTRFDPMTELPFAIAGVPQAGITPMGGTDPGTDHILPMGKHTILFLPVADAMRVQMLQSPGHFRLRAISLETKPVDRLPNGTVLVDYSLWLQSIIAPDFYISIEHFSRLTNQKFASLLDLSHSSWNSIGGDLKIRFFGDSPNENPILFRPKEEIGQIGGPEGTKRVAGWNFAVLDGRPDSLPVPNLYSSHPYSYPAWRDFAAALNLGGNFPPRMPNNHRKAASFFRYFPEPVIQAALRAKLYVQNPADRRTFERATHSDLDVQSALQGSWFNDQLFYERVLPLDAEEAALSIIPDSYNPDNVSIAIGTTSIDPASMRRYSPLTQVQLFGNITKNLFIPAERRESAPQQIGNTTVWVNPDPSLITSGMTAVYKGTLPVNNILGADRSTAPVPALLWCTMTKHNEVWFKLEKTNTISAETASELRTEEANWFRYVRTEDKLLPEIRQVQPIPPRKFIGPNTVPKDPDDAARKRILEQLQQAK